jgi:hypothetical protein
MTYSERAQQLIVGCSVALVLLSGLAVYVRNRTDPYLFMSVDERLHAAWVAARNGRCDEADYAIRRAQRLDPGNATLRMKALEIDRECLAPKTEPLGSSSRQE